jgi:hypothetical protein
MSEPSSDHTTDALARAIEVLLFVPVGATSYLRELGPNVVETLVARGRAEVDARHEQVAKHLNTARSMGEVALTFGLPKLRARVGRQAEAARGRAEDFLASTTLQRTPPPPAPEPVIERDEPPAPPIVTISPNGAEDTAAHAALPIPGYDALSASQVVERLAGLVPDELDAVRKYEAAHRRRRTILGKIEQLAG